MSEFQGANLVASNNLSIVKSKPDDVLAKRRTTCKTYTKGHLPNVLALRAYNPSGLTQIPTRVLLEEDYTSILETIIQRDFFPDLLRLIEAQGIADYTVVENLQRQLTSLDSNIPLEGTACQVKLLDGRELEIQLSKLTLQQFQSLFTSEDNASFEQIVFNEKAKLLKQQQWMEEAALQHNELNAGTIAALEMGERPNNLIYSNLDARNGLMFPLTDGNIGNMELQRTSDGKIMALCLGEYNRDKSTATLTRGGVLNPKNTRLASGAGQALNEEMQRAAEAKQEALEKEKKNESLYDTMVNQGIYSAYELMKRQGKSKNDLLETPLRSDGKTNYEFLHTPVLQPGVNMSPIMTWGKIAATPIRISNEDTSSRLPTFSIPEPSTAETIGMRLADDVSKKMRQKKKTLNGIKQVLQAANTPLTSRTQTDLFGTPARVSGIDLLREHSRSKRTPSIHTNMLKRYKPQGGPGMVRSSSSINTNVLLNI